MSADGHLVTDIGIVRAPGGRWRLRESRMQLHPAPRALLVRMLYSPINPADLLAIAGDYAFTLDQDDVLGAEGVGRIEAVGADVAGLSKGDLVLPLGRGNWRQLRLLDAADVVRVPANLDARQAAMLRINPATALHLLAGADLARGDWLIQNGAASAVGHWTRAFAREAGIKVINVVRQLGSNAPPQAVVDDDDLVEEVAMVAPAERVLAAFDCVAGEATGRLATCLAAGGRITVFGHLSGAPCQVRSQLLTGKALTIRGFSLRPAEGRMDASERAAMFARIFAAAADPANRLPIREVIPMTRIEDALAAARAPGVGRVLIDLGA